MLDYRRVYPGNSSNVQREAKPVVDMNHGLPYMDGMGYTGYLLVV